MTESSAPRNVMSGRTVGELRATFVPDGETRVRPSLLFPGVPAQTWAGYADDLDGNGMLVLTAGALLVEHGERALLIDTGTGPSVPADPAMAELFSARGGDLVNGLRRLGRTAESIEAVAVSHLHVEHIGWLGLEGGPFAHAMTLVERAEWAVRQPSFGVDQARLEVIARNVRAFDPGDELFPGVRALGLPGHTPGHSGFLLESEGEQMPAFGDVLHVARQAQHPEWTVAVDDVGADEGSRRGTLERLADDGSVGYGNHLSNGQFGRVHRDGDRYRWCPVPADPASTVTS